MRELLTDDWITDVKVCGAKDRSSTREKIPFSSERPGESLADMFS